MIKIILANIIYLFYALSLSFAPEFISGLLLGISITLALDYLITEIINGGNRNE